MSARYLPPTLHCIPKPIAPGAAGLVPDCGPSTVRLTSSRPALAQTKQSTGTPGGWAASTARPRSQSSAGSSGLQWSRRTSGPDERRAGYTERHGDRGSEHGHTGTPGAALPSGCADSTRCNIHTTPVRFQFVHCMLTILKATSPAFSRWLHCQTKLFNRGKQKRFHASKGTNT